MTRGRPMAVVAVLLLLLTYLLIKSRSPISPARMRAHQALQAVQLHDGELNRAVLMARAGLLLHYDSVAATGHGLERELHTLTVESTRLAADGDPARAPADARAGRDHPSKTAARAGLHLGQCRAPELDHLLGVLSCRT